MKSLDAIISATTHITDDSRKVKAGGIFIAIDGYGQDGHSYIDAAIKNGANTIIINAAKESQVAKHDGVTYVAVDNTRVALSYICSKIYKRPDDIVAVTGTNGKTSVAYFTAKILELLEQKAAYVGTLGVMAGDSPDFREYNSLTTPGTLILNEILDKLKARNFNKVAIEASSHGLHQHRLDYIDFKAGAFTEFGRDHLDYHKDLDSYLDSKLILFNQLLPKAAFAVINSDMEVSERVVSACKSRQLNILSYGYKGEFAKILSIEYHGLNMKVQAMIDGKKYELPINLFGDFQAFNVLCATLLVHSLGFKIEDCVKAIGQLTSVPGRMERVENYNIFVDYAHTPDALEGACKVIRNSNHKKEGRLILVFGCGGDRDKGKRPLMGAVAAKYADVAIVTDDNPRTEDAEQIRREIMAQCPNAANIGNREEAIRHAIQSMKSDDILLIAGKGHEYTQIFADKTIEFNDSKIAMKYAAGIY